MSRSDIVDFVLLSAIWGVSFLFMRIAVPEFGPFALIGIRCGLAAMCLLPLVLLREGPTQMRSHVRELTVLGFANAFIPFTLLAYAALSLTTGFAALINATTPLWAGVVGLVWLSAKLTRLLWAGVVGLVWLSAKLTRLQWVGLALGVVGMAVLTWGKVDFKPGGSGLAIVAGLTATLAYGFASHFAKRRLSKVSPLGVATGSQVVGTILVLPLAIIYWPATQPSAKAWAAAILLAVLATAIALIVYFRLIWRLGGQKASSVTFLIPVFAAGWGAAVLGEIPTTPMYVGGAIVLVGTALTLGFGARFTRNPISAVQKL